MPTGVVLPLNLSAPNVTDDVAAGRELAAQRLAFYQTIPSYRKVIAREGVSEVAELAAIGSAAQVRVQLQSYLDAGASDVALSPLRTEPTDLQALLGGCRHVVTGLKRRRPAPATRAP